MEAFFPSEVARLVLGYLEEHDCQEIAKSFLDKSPLLQECRILAAKGRRYKTKVNGLNLTDILDQFCVMHEIIQEFLDNVPDAKSLKYSHNLVEKLQFLLERTKKQPILDLHEDFGSPIIAGSGRSRCDANIEVNKHQYSCQFQEKSGCVISKSNELLPNKSKCSKLSSSSLEDKSLNKVDSAIVPPLIDSNTEVDSLNRNKNCDAPVSQNVSKNFDSERISSQNKCTTATDTEELLNYSSTEVQTTPPDLQDLESDINEDPIENLSILTKALLNRTELHEKIAETINNKVINPIESSFKEESFSGNPDQTNISIMNAFNNAVKSAAEAAEADPMFEKFLKDIIGEKTDDTNLDEDTDCKPDKDQEIEEQIDTQNDELMEFDDGLTEPIIQENNKKSTDVPLKQRLRNSVRPQVNEEQDLNNDNDMIAKLNEEAVMNIVNVNKGKCLNNVHSEVSSTINKALLSPVKVSQKGQKSTKKVSKSASKRKTPKKPKPEFIEQPSVDFNIDEQDTVPTLILCSKEEMNGVSEASAIPVAKGLATSNLIPIAPKDANGKCPSRTNFINTQPKQIYLRTVNVPRRLTVQSSVWPTATSQTAPIVINMTNSPIAPTNVVTALPSTNMVTALPLTSVVTALSPTNMVTAIPNGQLQSSECITLYGSDTASELKLTPSSLPVVSIENNASLTGTGLSPYLKFQHPVQPSSSTSAGTFVAKDSGTESSSANSETKSIENKNNIIASDVITRRTPRSLMQARSKNLRLSLSTPRKRHVRALDFDTPSNSSSTKKKTLQSAVRAKSVCRSTLFKSPLYTSDFGKIKLPSPAKEKIYSVEEGSNIPTSPLPKLRGDWEKYTGVGMIIGDNTSDNTSASVQKPQQNNKLLTEKSVEIKKSWDSDLRKIIASNEENTADEGNEKGKKPKRKYNKHKPSKKQLAADITKCAKTSKKGTQKTKQVKNQSIIDKRNESIESSFEDHQKSDRDFSDCELKIALEKEENCEDSCKIQDNNEKTLLSKIAAEKNDNATKQQTSKTSPNSSTLSVKAPNFLDLETPRKDLPLQCPPTPRLHTPGDNLIKSFPKASETKSLKDFMNTPDFPKTPCITITPKHFEIASDNSKKASPYYEPNTEPPEFLNNNPEETSIIAGDGALQENKEITEFKVIKGNLKSSKDILVIADKNSKNIDNAESDEDINDLNASKDSDTTDSNSDSSDDDSSSTSNSSSSSSSSDSSSSEESSPEKSTSPDKQKYLDNSNETEDSNKNGIISYSEKDEGNNKEDNITKNEKSPEKVFPLTVNLNQCAEETPAKQENIAEEIISETPQSSKPGIENLTNLSSKLTATMSSGTDKSNAIESKETRNKTFIPINDTNENIKKPKIINVQILNQNNSIPLPTEMSNAFRGEKNLPLGIAMGVGKMHSKQVIVNSLEEKRVRVAQKCKLTENAAANTKSKANILGKRKLRSGMGTQTNTAIALSNLKNCSSKITVQNNKIIKDSQKGLNENLAKFDDISKNNSKNQQTSRKKMQEKCKENENSNKLVDKLNKNIKIKTEYNEKDLGQLYANKEQRLVDRVKRDLFSDDENNDQDTHRECSDDSVTEITKEKFLGKLGVTLTPGKNQGSQNSFSTSPNNIPSSNEIKRNHLDVALVFNDKVPREKNTPEKFDKEYQMKIPIDEEKYVLLQYSVLEKLDLNLKVNKTNTKKTPCRMTKKKPDYSERKSATEISNARRKPANLKRKLSPLKEQKPAEKRQKDNDSTGSQTSCLYLGNAVGKLKNLDVDTFVNNLHKK